MKVIGHLVKTMFHAFFRVLVTAILSATLAVAVGLLVAYEATNQWPPRHLVDVLIGVVAMIFTYATVLTVLVSEALRTLLYTVKEAEKQTYTAGNIVERAIKAADHVEQAEHEKHEVHAEQLEHAQH